MSPEEILAAIRALPAQERLDVEAKVSEGLGSPCWWCGGEASLLCDTQLLSPDPVIEGWFKSRKVTRRFVFDGEHSCDAEMCEGCAERLSVVHMSGHDFDDEGEMIGEHHVDTLDACPYCAANPKRNAHTSAAEYRLAVRRHAEEKGS